MRTLITTLVALTATVLLPMSAPVQAGHYEEETVIVRCESTGGRDNYCPIDTRGGVYISDQLSYTDCIEDENWGTDRGGIWVSDGCRADFEVTQAYRGGRGAPAGGNGRPWQDEGRRGGVSVVCESRDRRTTQCPIRVRSSVDLVTQYSSAECRFNYSWGYDRNGIWVDRGCRAEFLVY